MFDIGFLELVLVGVIALLVLGPERLPHAARTAGRWVGAARRMVNQVSSEIDREIKTQELREKLKREGDTLGLEKIRATVDEALAEARNFDHLTENPITPPPPAEPGKSTTETTKDVPAEAAGDSPQANNTIKQDNTTLTEKIVPLQRQDANRP